MGYAPPRPLLVFTVAALSVPAAAAQAFSQVALRPSPERAVATCLRYAGTPGSLALLGPPGRRSSPADFVEAGEAGLTNRGRASVGALDDCPAVASNPSKVTVVAGRARGKGSSVRIRALIRDPAGARSPLPVTLARSSLADQGPLVAAVSPAGDVVVAWAEIRRTFNPPDRERARVRFMAATRRRGGAFGPAQTLAGWRRSALDGEPLVVAAFDASGRATIALARPIPDRRRFGGLASIETATAPAGGRFGRRVRVGSTVQETGRLALAVAPDGRALLAYDGGQGVNVSEREPGSARFREPARFDRGQFARDPALAMRADGGAVVVWRTETGRGSGVRAVTRSAPGAFGSPVSLARPRRERNGGTLVLGLAEGKPSPPLDDANLGLSAALAEDGRFAIAWTANRRPTLGERLRAPRAVGGTLTGGFDQATTLGCPCRPVNGVAALLTAGGGPAVAWTDNLTTSPFGGSLELPRLAGRLHLARPDGAPPPSPPKRRLTLAVRSPQALRFGQGVRVVARCNRACDLRAVVRRRPGRNPRALGTAEASRGQTVLHVRPPLSTQLAPRGGGRLTVIVRGYTRNSSTVATARTSVRVRRVAPPPLARPRDVRAKRRRGSIVVTWRTARPAAGVSFLVEGRRSRRRSRRIAPFRFFAYEEGRRARRFRALLKVKPGDVVRFVAVTATRNAAPGRLPAVVVPVLRVGRRTRGAGPAR